VSSEEDYHSPVDGSEPLGLEASTYQALSLSPGEVSSHPTNLAKITGNPTVNPTDSVGSGIEVGDLAAPIAVPGTFTHAGLYDQFLQSGGSDSLHLTRFDSISFIAGQVREKVSLNTLIIELINMKLNNEVGQKRWHLGRRTNSICNC
jgi:hypothetical protein